MRFDHFSVIATGILLLVPSLSFAQGEGSRSVSGGGISVPGWTGKVDPGEGKTINDDKFSKQGNAFDVTTGPAVTYWNPANQATGDYTVKATFKEPKYMN